MSSTLIERFKEYEIALNKFSKILVKVWMEKSSDLYY